MQRKHQTENLYYITRCTLYGYIEEIKTYYSQLNQAASTYTLPMSKCTNE